MNLYRLDYVDTDGNVTGPVHDWRGDVLCRHMTTARKRAQDFAAETRCDVLVSRIGGKSASVRGVLVIRPDGTASKPPGAKGEDCTARPDGPPCFCKNCRAGRRAR